MIDGFKERGKKHVSLNIYWWFIHTGADTVLGAKNAEFLA